MMDLLLTDDVEIEATPDLVEPAYQPDVGAL